MIPYYYMCMVCSYTARVPLSSSLTSAFCRLCLKALFSSSNCWHLFNKASSFSSRATIVRAYCCDCAYMLMQLETYHSWLCIQTTSSGNKWRTLQSLQYKYLGVYSVKRPYNIIITKIISLCPYQLLRLDIPMRRRVLTLMPTQCRQ